MSQTHHFVQAMTSGFEGREEELGRAISTTLKTLKNVTPYKHETNDALIKAWLVSIQFAKDRQLLEEFVAHDVKVMEPVNRVLRKLIEKSGDAEQALIGLFDHTACHYHLVLETRVEPGKRSWVSPFKNVLDISRRIGQFDLTEQEIHERWTVPRLQGYARSIGVELQVSDWNDQGLISCSLN